jgi:hypothetical protein
VSGSSQGDSSPDLPNKSLGATGAVPLSGIVCGGVVSAAAGARQTFWSKTTNLIVTGARHDSKG